MKNFVVSARKYRPATFGHVVGQAHITTTLKNAIKGKQLAQAFLFCGPRGVGKTTCARILAKTINCERVTTDTEPCNTCPSCTSFNDQGSFNIHELDAASNSSVEDIRSLIEQVRYPPQSGQYKVYIIDEVHMLSNNAFNAFLKTLEEPPSYAIFILATTEKYKIIPTILSRCQIFDFRRIPAQAMVAQLKYVAQQENITYEEEALHLISEKSDGSLRDALSIFDLIITFSSKKVITYQATLEHLHILDHAYYFRLTDAFLQHDPGAALLIYDEILKAGFDGQRFITGLSEHFRNLMMGQHPTTLQLLPPAERIKEQYQIQAAQAAPAFLFSALEVTNRCDSHYKTSNNKRLHVELALIALAHPQEASLPKTSTTNQPIQLPSPPPAPPAKPAIAEKSKEVSQPNNEVSQPKNTATLAKNAPQQSPKKPSSGHTTIKLPQIEEIKKHLKKQDTIAAPASPSELITRGAPITSEAVVNHWQAYAQQLKEAGKMSEYGILNQKITLEGTTIVVKLVNAVQQDLLADLKEDLLAYLRRHLHCSSITLKAEVVPTEKSTKPYTAQEKLRYLVERYPALRTVQEKLSLEVQD